MNSLEILRLLDGELFYHKNRREWEMAVDLLRRLFRDHDADLAPVRDMAVNIRDRIVDMDPFIQRTTLEVCPQCPEVCCRAMHGRYDGQDLIYAQALGLDIPDYLELKDHDQCQFMSERGCVTERKLRPLRCSLYFCKPLLEHMGKGPSRPNQEFNALLSEAKGLWEKMPGETLRIASGLLNMLYDKEFELEV